MSNDPSPQREGEQGLIKNPEKQCAKRMLPRLTCGVERRSFYNVPLFSPLV